MFKFEDLPTGVLHDIYKMISKVEKARILHLIPEFYDTSYETLNNDIIIIFSQYTNGINEIEEIFDHKAYFGRTSPPIVVYLPSRFDCRQPTDEAYREAEIQVRETFESLEYYQVMRTEFDIDRWKPGKQVQLVFAFDIEDPDVFSTTDFYNSCVEKYFRWCSHSLNIVKKFRENLNAFKKSECGTLGLFDATSSIRINDSDGFDAEGVDVVQTDRAKNKGNQMNSTVFFETPVLKSKHGSKFLFRSTTLFRTDLTVRGNEKKQRLTAICSPLQKVNIIMQKHHRAQTRLTFRSHTYKDRKTGKYNVKKFIQPLLKEYLNKTTDRYLQNVLWGLYNQMGDSMTEGHFADFDAGIGVDTADWFFEKLEHPLEYADPQDPGLVRWRYHHYIIDMIHATAHEHLYNTGNFGDFKRTDDFASARSLNQKLFVGLNEDTVDQIDLEYQKYAYKYSYGRVEELKPAAVVSYTLTIFENSDERYEIDTEGGKLTDWNKYDSVFEDAVGQCEMGEYPVRYSFKPSSNCDWEIMKSGVSFTDFYDRHMIIEDIEELEGMNLNRNLNIGHQLELEDVPLAGFDRFEPQEENSDEEGEEEDDDYDIEEVHPRRYIHDMNNQVPVIDDLDPRLVHLWRLAAALNQGSEERERLEQLMEEIFRETRK
ncbi:hypothetical protein WICPIJ_002083 [Wickerhamomyces pijperi]|uniref:Uncharacterized protein n=1 Tax=Wickerhamomyces pijperi TaxID=599730 RepID=A0A9P8QCC0_WICPI|nr:hypothetical protein WICPIJ_002083 [Wickerhamomyces pijperi]